MPEQRRAGLLDGIALTSRANFRACRIDAELVLAGIAEEGLGIDCAGEVDVQIGTLGKLIEKGAQGQRTVAQGGLVGAGGAGIRGGGLGAGWGWGGGEGGKGETGEKKGRAAHDAFQCRAKTAGAGGFAICAVSAGLMRLLRLCGPGLAREVGSWYTVRSRCSQLSGDSPQRSGMQESARRIATLSLH